MADAKIDKSLDDIIKERRISVRGRGGARGGRGGGGFRGRFRGASAGAAGTSGTGRFSRRGGPGSGAVNKRRSAGSANNSVLISPNKAAAINGQWNHDLYQNGGRRGAAAVATVAATSSGPAKLVISNLDFGVNDSDIKGLFQEFGIIKKAAVHYDRSGRSLGTADVVFERKQDAIMALKKYNGVSLDGRPMNIQLTASLVSAPVAQVQIVPRIMVQQGSPRRGGFSGGRGGFSARRGGGRGGARQPPKSAADLDADLDAYNAKMQTD